MKIRKIYEDLREKNKENGRSEKKINRRNNE